MRTGGAQRLREWCWRGGGVLGHTARCMVDGPGPPFSAPCVFWVCAHVLQVGGNLGGTLVTDT